MKLPSKILVTGTDTGVGKTYVTGELAQALLAAGKKVKVFKPLESGVSDAEPRDAQYLYEKLNGTQGLEEIHMYQFAEPLSPHIAAEREGIQVDTSKIIDKIDRLAGDSDVLLVEGAGGLRVPIVGNYTYAELAKDAGLTVLIVAGNKLGVINHLLLTQEVAKTTGLDVLPFILNDLSSDLGLAAQTNLEAIKLCSNLECLLHLPFNGQIEKETLLA